MKFSRRVEDPSGENPLTARLSARRAGGRPVLDLTETNPARAGVAPQESEIREALDRPGIHRYDPDPRGLAGAREAVASYYRLDGLSAAAERIVLTSGSSEAYSFLFKLLCNPGDRILAPRPSYPLFEHLAGLDGVGVDFYASRRTEDGGWRLDLDAVARAFTEHTRAILAVHPNNPTGAYLTPEELEQLGGFCARHGAAFVADEVFFDYPSRVRPPMRRRADGIGGALTFSLSGLSKVAGLPQLKLGWILVGGKREIVREALARLEFIADAYLSVGAGVQASAAALLALRVPAQEKIRDRLERNEHTASSLCRGLLEPRLRLREGGWHLVLELGRGRTDEPFALDLLEEDGVFVHPGYFYDFEEEHLLVASLLTPEETFRVGLERLLARAVPGR